VSPSSIAAAIKALPEVCFVILLAIAITQGPLALCTFAFFLNHDFEILVSHHQLDRRLTNRASWLFDSGGHFNGK